MTGNESPDLPHPFMGSVRALLSSMVPGPGRLRRAVSASAPTVAWGDVGDRAGRPSRAVLREREQRTLREWAVLRDRLTGIARERLADVGDLLSDARLEFTPGTAETAVRRDYVWAVEAFQAAGKLLDEAADLPDLAAAVVLADRALERFAAAHTRHGGGRPPAQVVRCFYNPLHGRAEQHQVGKADRRGKRRGGRRTMSAREAAARRRPACASCRLAILAAQVPDVLPALLTVKVSRRLSTKILVPYYAVPQQSSMWSVTGCGAYDDAVPGQVMRGEHRRRPAG
jgi:hypothetical protein